MDIHYKGHHVVETPEFCYEYDGKSYVGKSIISSQHVNHKKAKTDKYEKFKTYKIHINPRNPECVIDKELGLDDGIWSLIGIEAFIWFLICLFLAF